MGVYSLMFFTTKVNLGTNLKALNIYCKILFIENKVSNFCDVTSPVKDFYRNNCAE